MRRKTYFCLFALIYPSKAFPPVALSTGGTPTPTLCLVGKINLVSSAAVEAEFQLSGMRPLAYCQYNLKYLISALPFS